jgi:hypothetical protein
MLDLVPPYHLCSCDRSVLDWLRRFAEDRGLKWQQDAVGNMVVRKPGQGGGESAATVVIQVRHWCPYAQLIIGWLGGPM